MGTGFGPGLMVPVTASPSQSNTRSRRVRSSSSGPQSPLHEPFRGCPYCADAVTAPKASAATPPIIARNAVRTVLFTAIFVVTGLLLPPAFLDAGKVEHRSTAGRRNPPQEPRAISPGSPSSATKSPGRPFERTQEPRAVPPGPPIVRQPPSTGR